MRSTTDRYVSRGGLKLEHALREFGVDPSGLACADLGCNVGGFTDCLLRHGATRVHAVDTGYGVLDYRLRIDPRVVVMERSNAIHAEPGAMMDSFSGVDLVVIDMGWTPQRYAIPAALKWLRSQDSGGGASKADSSAGARGQIITLIKPHYELSDDEKRRLLVDGALAPGEAERVFQRVLESMPALGVRVMAHTRSPITGGKSSARKGGAGNIEFLALLRPEESGVPSDP